MSIYEKVADELELASHTHEQINLAGRAVCAEALKPETAPGQIVTKCLGCGDELPSVRIEMKRVRCAPCQVEKERLAKLGRF